MSTLVLSVIIIYRSLIPTFSCLGSFIHLLILHSFVLYCTIFCFAPPILSSLLLFIHLFMAPLVVVPPYPIISLPTLETAS